MIDWLVVSAALLAGLLGNLHCALMCGGIAVGLASGHPGGGWPAAMRLNLGRVGGYTLAGGLVGGLGAGLLAVLRQPQWQLGLRLAVGLVLIALALRIAWPQRFNALAGPAQALWRRLQPLHRQLLPADRPWRQWAAGALWGWLPCGLSGSLLTAAWLSADALQGALIMSAFGSGTLLVMLPLTWTGARAAGWLQGRTLRFGGAALLAAAGAITLLAPWLAQLPGLHAVLSALGCQTRLP